MKQEQTAVAEKTIDPCCSLCRRVGGGQGKAKQERGFGGIEMLSLVQKPARAPGDEPVKIRQVGELAQHRIPSRSVLGVLQ